jgi:hypothetical protein
MTTVVSGFASTSSKGNNNGNGSGSGTEFLSILPPAGEALKDWDNTKPHDQYVTLGTNHLGGISRGFASGLCPPLLHPS